MYWTTSNVCRYNFAIDKRTNILNILTDQIDPSNYQRVIKNLKIISVIIYQELNTDIRGNPN